MISQKVILVSGRLVIESLGHLVICSVRSAFHLRASPSLFVRAAQRSQRAHPAARMPAAARDCYFSATYGTFSLRSPMAESHGLPSRALIQGFTYEDFFRNL